MCADYQEQKSDLRKKWFTKEGIQDYYTLIKQTVKFYPALMLILMLLISLGSIFVPLFTKGTCICQYNTGYGLNIFGYNINSNALRYLQLSDTAC